MQLLLIVKSWREALYCGAKLTKNVLDMEQSHKQDSNHDTYVHKADLVCDASISMVHVVVLSLAHRETHSHDAELMIFPANYSNK